MKVWDPNGTSKVSPMVAPGFVLDAPTIGLGTGFWFFHEMLSFHVADFEYNPQNREYLIVFEIFQFSIMP